jgi:hypothetical protein
VIFSLIFELPRIHIIFQKIYKKTRHQFQNEKPVKISSNIEQLNHKIWFHVMRDIRSRNWSCDFVFEFNGFETNFAVFCDEFLWVTILNNSIVGISDGEFVQKWGGNFVKFNEARRKNCDLIYGWISRENHNTQKTPQKNHKNRKFQSHISGGVQLNQQNQ